MNKKRFSCNLSEMRSENSDSSTSDLNSIKEDLLPNATHDSDGLNANNVFNIDDIDVPNNLDVTNSVDVDVWPYCETNNCFEETAETNCDTNDDLADTKLAENIDISDTNLDMADTKSEQTDITYDVSDTNNELIVQEDNLAFIDNEEEIALDNVKTSKTDSECESNKSFNLQTQSILNDKLDNLNILKNSILNDKDDHKNMNIEIYTAVADDIEDENGNLDESINADKAITESKALSADISESIDDDNANEVKEYNRRPSVEFNVYSPRAPPKIKVELY